MRPLFELVGPNLVNKILQRIADVESIQHAHTEIDRELQARFTGRRLDSFLLLEEQDAETVEACILQCEPVLCLVHPKAARPTRSCRKENVIVQDVIAGDSLLFEALEMLDEVSHCEVGWIALAIVAVFLARLEIRDVGRGNHLALVTGALED